MNVINAKFAYMMAFFFMFIALASGALFIYFHLSQLVSADRVKDPMPKVQQVEIKDRQIKGTPNRLSISTLDIDLRVNKGAYDPVNQTWTLDSESVFVNTLTNPQAIIGEVKGDVPVPLLYGHNSPHILGKTKNLRVGQKLNVYTDNNYALTYSYSRSIELEPHESWILNYQGKEDLLLMTCSGTWHEKRRVLFFDLEKIQKVET